MPRVNASNMSTGSILPVHMTRITRILGGYWNLETPARSAPAYEHQLHRKATNLGSNGFDMCKPPYLCLLRFLSCYSMRRRSQVQSSPFRVTFL
jgi:hypothetical protein